VKDLWMVLAETWHGIAPAISHPVMKPIFTKLFFTQRGEPELFENVGVQPEPNHGITR